VGPLELALRQLREKLEAEGLFDPDHKQPIPSIPGRIGVVTSPTGAAVRDILRTLRRRFPCAEVVVVPVRVQGPQAAGEIAAAIANLDRFHHMIGGVDVLIVARGGGSLEDLWPFNEEAVARAIHDCRIPVISGVGHEADITICDLVADLRAATPTAAAELAAPNRNDLQARVDQTASRILRRLCHHLDLLQARLSGVLSRRALRDPYVLVGQREQRLDEIEGRMTRAVRDSIHEHHRTAARCETALQHIHPRAMVAEATRLLAARVHRLNFGLWRSTGRCENRLSALGGRLRAAAPHRQIGLLRERAASQERRLFSATIHRLALAAERLGAVAGKLQATSYRTTLARGFSITRLKRGRQVVRDVRSLRDGVRLLTETASGEVESQVVNAEQWELFE
jgi:exodeoxyribonuclease VII large subunit